MKTIPSLLLTFFLFCGTAFSQLTIPIPDTGWRLWLDRDASWAQDSIYLPEEVVLQTLPQNLPTGGWQQLNSANGIPVTLPSTVEEHYWGASGMRKYQNEEYAYETEDTVVRNGSYLGVSWWWTTVDVPKSFSGKLSTLRIRGARLRAEIYVNQQLVGYSIITETAISCDVSKALKPGAKNQIAIRITNPGGRLDWVDTQLMTWGTTAQVFHKSHGFGGLDRGITLVAHDRVYVTDLWTLNTPAAHSIDVHATISNMLQKDQDITMHWEVLDLQNNNTLCAQTLVQARLHPGDTSFTARIDVPYARLWSPQFPALYRLRATLHSSDTKKKLILDVKEVRFGFRWFTAEGIGTNALLRFNGDRIRLTSAISWGFWGFNGLWPTPELAAREVNAAKSLGMNCIQFHRNVGKTEALDAHDSIGLFRYMEPGGGQTSFGQTYSLYAQSPADTINTSGFSSLTPTFAERYMEEKIVRMVRDHRSHPSLLLYAIQNEIHPDLHNTRVFRILRRIHQEDPSRIVVLKSGFPSGSPSTNQAWMAPYSDSVYHDDGKAYSGWWDDHTVGGPGVWRDAMYKDTSDFTHKSLNDREIVMWGEMLGAAALDNHAAMIAELTAKGKKSYDLLDHQQIDSAYNRFLDRWNFRKAFPTTDALYGSIGNKEYDFWGRVIETARLAESNDYFVISGWESTAIENHSGLVDNLRNFKGDPALIRTRLAPLRIAIKSRSLVYTQGDSLAVDLFLLNESGIPCTGTVALTLIDPTQRQQSVGTCLIPSFTKDKFVYLLGTSLPMGRLREEGTHTVRAHIQGGTLTTEEQFLVVNPSGAITSPKRVGILSSLPELSKPFMLLPGVSAEPYRPDGKYELVIAANRFVKPPETQTDATTQIKNTDDPELYRTISYGDPNSLEFFIPNLPNGLAKVTLKFAELFQEAPAMRVFDVALNGDTVLRDFDVFKAAGGKNIAYDRVYSVPISNNTLRISFPRVPKPSARICAFKIAVRDTIVAINCGGKKYTDRRGLVWLPYQPPQQLTAQVLSTVMAGTPLLVLAEGEAATAKFAEELGEAGAIRYLGTIGEARASWMGSWYFVKEHPLFNGLPVNTCLGSEYQVPVSNSCGVLVDGAGVDVIAAYSRDHDRSIGAGCFSASLGKGKIIFLSMAGFVSGLNGQSQGIHPVIAKKIVANAINLLTSKK